VPSIPACHPAGSSEVAPHLHHPAAAVLRALLTCALLTCALVALAGGLSGCMTAASGPGDLHRLLSPYTGQWESDVPVGQRELQTMDEVRYRLTLYATRSDELTGQMWLVRKSPGSGMREMVKFTNLPRPRYTAAVKCIKRGASGYTCLLELERAECGGTDCHLTCPELQVEDGHLTSSNGDLACHFRRPFRD
jgi:hypothetical protein